MIVAHLESSFSCFNCPAILQNPCPGVSQHPLQAAIFVCLESEWSGLCNQFFLHRLTPKLSHIPAWKWNGIHFYTSTLLLLLLTTTTICLGKNSFQQKQHSVRRCFHGNSRKINCCGCWQGVCCWEGSLCRLFLWNCLCFYYISSSEGLCSILYVMDILNGFTTVCSLYQYYFL